MRTLFWLYRSKKNSRGLCPIYLRITTFCKSEMSTGFFVDPEDWSSEYQSLKPTTPKNREINRALQNLGAKAIEKHNKLGNVHPAKIILDMKPKRIMTVIDKCCAGLMRLKSIKGPESTYKNYKSSFSLLESFILKYPENKVVLNEEELSYWLFGKGYTAGYVSAVVKRISKLISGDFKPYVAVERDLKYLTPRELEIIENMPLSGSDRYYRNLFMVGCYTGLGYSELKKLCWNHIQQVNVDGELINFIVVKRQKTRRFDLVSRIPLSEKAFGFVKDLLGSGIAVPSNKTVNEKYQVFSKEVGKKITTHVARHTFATKMLLEGYTMDVVSKMMGHASISVTEGIYGDITVGRIGSEFLKVNEFLRSA